MTKPVTHLLRSLLAVLLFISAHQAQAQAWYPVGVNDSNWASFNPYNLGPCDVAYSSTGIPYVIYTNSYSTVINYKMSVRRYINNSWEFVGRDTFSAPSAINPKIVLDNSNTPYILYTTQSAVVVQKFNGTSWVNLGAGNPYNFPSGTGYYAAPGSASLAVDAAGMVYVSFIESNSSFTYGTMRTMKYDGTSWTTLSTPGAFLVSTYGRASMALNAAGVPYLAYQDVASGYKATVRKWDGTSWVIAGSGPASANPADYLNIAFDRYDTAYIAYYDYNVTKKAVVLKFNGSTAWSAVGTPQGTPFTANTPVSEERLAFDINNVPYLSYVITNGTDAMLKKFTGGAWTNVTPILSSGYQLPQYNVIAADPAGGIIQVNFDPGFGKLTARKYSGTTTTYLGDMGVNTASGPSIFMKLATDNTGTPYILYIDHLVSHKMHLKKYDGTSWVVVGSATVDTSQSIVSPDLAFDNTNTPYVSFTTGGATGNVKVVKLSGGSWVNVGTTGMATTGGGVYASMAIDKNNNVFIIFSDGTQSSYSSVRKYDGTGWAYVGAPGIATAIGPSKITMDKNGKPYILYVDQNRLTVKSYNGSSWALVGQARFSYYPPDYTDITTDTAGVPYVAYSSTSVQYSGASVQKFNDTNWVSVGPSYLTSYSASYITIRFDKARNRPYVCYGDGSWLSKATVQRLVGNTWQYAGRPGFTAPVVGGDVQMAMAPNGNVYAAYLSGGIFVRGNNVNNMCTGPDSIKATNITMHTADVQWNTTANATSYEYVLQPPGASAPPTSGTTITTGSVQFTGLLAGRTYTVYVRARCGASDSLQWISTYFTTSDSCFTPQTTVSNITSHAADINWGPANPSSVGFQIAVTTSATPPATGATLTANNYHASGLVASRTYYAHLRSLCGPDTASWSSKSFTTLDSCATPFKTIANITDTSADINWGPANPSSAGFQIAVTTSSTPPATGTTITANSYHASGLLPITNYYAHLRTLCSLDTAYWISTPFTTLQTPPVSVYPTTYSGNGIKCFPNPAKDRVTVTLYGNNDYAQLSLTDLTGRVIRNMNVTAAEMKLDIHTLPAGVYILKLSGTQNTRILKLTKN